MQGPSRTTATLIGITAVPIWSTLAMLAAVAGKIPPFQLNAMAFLVAGLIGAASWLRRPHAMRALIQPIGAWATGIAGLFGYHFLYFTALQGAPPIPASLINYLWPLLIVVFSALLPGEKLGWHHMLGAAMGLAGTVVVVTGGGGVAIAPEHVPGYLAAFGAALFWSSYSVLSRRFSAVPTDAVTGFCLATALLSLVSHLALETTVWPETWAQWAAVFGLGLGPVGGAFYFWDYGLKRGDIQVMGVSAYGAPLLSTLLLIVFGYGAFTLPVALAALLITGGALIAAKDMLFRKRRLRSGPSAT
ncbi:MAG TPA: DMT family transporter [Hyphomicrobiales bacterium]|nr:DMT family transporter [Hyphomicrobiales bacterium]